MSGTAAKAAAASAAAAALALGSALAFAAEALLSAGDCGGALGGASNTCHCTGLSLRSYPAGTLTLLKSVGPEFLTRVLDQDVCGRTGQYIQTQGGAKLPSTLLRSAASVLGELTSNQSHRYNSTAG